MPFILTPDRWRRQPPFHRAIALDRKHWAAQGLWGGLATIGNGHSFDLIRNTGTAIGVIGNTSQTVRGAHFVRGGVVGWQRSTSGAAPNARGRNVLTQTSDVTIAAVLSGHGLTTSTARASVGSAVSGFQIPGIREGNGSSNVWVARFRSASSTDVDAVGSTTAPVAGPARFVVAVYRNGVGIELWVDGVQEASTASALNLIASPALLQSLVATSGHGNSPLCLAWEIALSEARIRELSRNPWQLIRSDEGPAFYSLGSGPSFQPAWARGATSIAGVSANA